MSKKLSQQENYQSKWDDSSAAFYDSWDDTKEFKANGTVFQNSSGGGHKYSRELACSLYANAKVPKFDPDLLDEYTELDMEYSTMVNMYDTLQDELQAQADSLKETIGTEAQDTHMLGS